MKRMLTIACVVVGVWAPLGRAESAADSDLIEFKFQPKQGEVDRTRIVVKNVGAMQMPKPIPEQKFSQTIEQVWLTKCRKINDDGSAIFDVSFDKFAIEMSMGGIKMEFDSEAKDQGKNPDPYTDVVRKIFCAMTQAKFAMHVGADGRPTKFEGLKDMMDKVLAEIGDEAESVMAKKAVEQMRGMLDDEIMKQNIDSGCRLMPPKGSARIGDTWEHKWEFEMPMFNAKLQGKGEYKLTGIEMVKGRRCAKVRFSESYHMGQKPGSKQADPAKGDKSIFEKMDFEMTSSGGQGLGYWDFEQGDLVKLNHTDKMTIKVSFQPDPDAEDQASKIGFGPIVQKLRNSINLELIEGSEPAGEKKSATSQP